MRIFQSIAALALVTSMSACQSTGSYSIDADGDTVENDNVAGYSGGTSYSAVPAGGSGGHLSELTATGYASIDDQPGNSAALRRLMAIRVAKLDAYRVLAAQVIYDAKLERITPVGTTTYEVTLSLPKSSVRDLRRLYLGNVAISQR